MSSYLAEVLNASGGHAAPAENIDKKDIRSSLEAAGILIPEEQDLADALLEIVEKHGKFNDDNTGVWAGYTSAKENAANAEIGVKCGNCVFWEAPNGCKVIVADAEEGGLCRFAVLPDGAVSAAGKLEKSEDDPCWEGYVRIGMKKGKDGNLVPNCVPAETAQALDEISSVLTLEELEEVLSTYNSTVGSTRQVSLDAAATVASRALGLYADSCRDTELSNAVLWETHTFLEYATTGVSDELDALSEYEDLLAEGHPHFGITASAGSRLEWLSGSPELTGSTGDALKVVLSEDANPVEYLHASTRIKALIASGEITAQTAQLIDSALDIDSSY